MTATAVSTIRPSEGRPPPGLPSLGAVIVRTVKSVVIAVVAPAVLLAAMLVLFNLDVAVIVVLAWMVGLLCWRRATSRPASALLLLAAGIMTIKTAFTLATGNSFVYFVQPVFSDAAVATIFLGSLLTSRPIVARLAPDFYPVDAAIAARPAVQGLFRRLTLLWGLVIVVKGSMTLWLLLSLPTLNFVVIKGIAVVALTVAATAATIVLSAVVARREGLIGRGLLVGLAPDDRRNEGRPA